MFAFSQRSEARDQAPEHLNAASGRPQNGRDLEAWVAEVKERPAPPLDPLPVMKQFETFEYAAQNLRDPFSQPSANQDGDGGMRPDPDRRKEVLEAFPLDSLDMVGTIGTGPSVVGLVMGPDRVTYRVRPGNYMGLSDGRITAVFEEVNRSHADFGVVPLENSTDGRVADTLDMFLRMQLIICAEIRLRIHHNLLAACDQEAIRRWIQGRWRRIKKTPESVARA